MGLKIILFIFGISVASTHVLHNGKRYNHVHQIRGQIEAAKPELRHIPFSVFPSKDLLRQMPPYLSHFVQQKSNLFYKPQMMLSSNEFENIKDCEYLHVNEYPEIVIKEPLVSRIPMEDVEVLTAPETPMLPPSTVLDVATMTVDKPTAPIITDKPVIEIEKHVPFEVAHLPELPPLPVFNPPRPIEIISEDIPADTPGVNFEPIEIRSPPELPPLILPEFPTIVKFEAPQRIPEIIEFQPAPEFKPIEILNKSIEIIEIKPVVELPNESIEIIEAKLPEIPAAPELSPLEMPEIPTSLIVEQIPNKHIPCVHEIVLPQIQDEPIFMATSPGLPSSLVEIPMQVIDSEAPKLPEVEVPELKPILLHEIPKPPVLPPLSVQEISLPVAIDMLPPPANPEYVEVITSNDKEVPMTNTINFPIERPAQVIEIDSVKIPNDPDVAPIPIMVPDITNSVMIETSSHNEKYPCLEDIVNIEGYPTHPIAHIPFSFPSFYAQNIIIERVLPNIILNKEDYTKTSKTAPVGTKYPVYPLSFFTPTH